VESLGIPRLMICRPENCLVGVKPGHFEVKESPMRATQAGLHDFCRGKARNAEMDVEKHF